MPFFVHVRDGWLECWLAVDELEWVVALSTHECFGRRVDLTVAAGTLIRSGGTCLRVASKHFAYRIKMSAKHAGVRCTVLLQPPNNLEHLYFLVCLMRRKFTVYYPYFIGTDSVSLFSQIQEESWTKDKGRLG